MTDPLDYWQRRESKSQRVYGLSGPDGVPVDTQRRPSRQVPPRATVKPRVRGGSGGEPDAADGEAGETADDTASAGNPGTAADAARSEGDGGEVNDLEADIAVERDSLETVDPENPPA
ncbi:hypothetical protein ACWKWP_11295 [Agromyces soli]